MPAWEYKTVVRATGEMLSDEQLNLLGTHGFEMTGVVTVSEKVTIVGRQETHTQVHYFFKRPRAAGPAVPATGAPKPPTAVATAPPAAPPAAPRPPQAQA
jgi:hypothetical protein